LGKGVYARIKKMILNLSLSLLIYIKDEYRNKEEMGRFIDDMFDIKDELTDEPSLSTSYKERYIYNSVLSVAAPASDAILKVFFILGVLIIAFLLLMIIKIKVMKEGEDYAIFKSLGYTSLNIMLSISVSMLFVSLIAGIVGGLLGGLLVTPLLDAVGAAFGVASMGFIVNWAYIAYIFIGINAVVFLLSMLMSLRVRRISPIKMLRRN